MDQQTFLDLRHLLLALEPWNDPRRRRTLVKAALWNHSLLSQIDLGGAPNESASDLLTACVEFDQPTERGLTPLCALLAEIRVQGLVDGRLKDRFEVLTDRLGCDTPVIDWPYDPYPGMLALDHHQAPIFFGRRAETLQLLTKLDTEQGRRLLMVAGASGCGKSSLVRAGLWATLKNPEQTRLHGSVDWAITAMIPSEPVCDPFQALVASLARAPEPVPGLDRERAEADRLRADPARFADLRARVLAGRPAHAEWLLIIDQFEELFTVIGPALCARFLDDLLLPALSYPRFRIVATVRSDFLDRCIAHPGLLAELNADGQFGVGAPGPAGMTCMIEGPVRQLRLKQPVALDDALTDRLVADAAGTPGGLALLAFSLKDLYEHCRDKGRMDLQDYLSKDIGGLAGIIAKRAEAAVVRAGVDTATVLPRVFSRLLTVQPDGAATRRREDWNHWQEDPKAHALIEALANQQTRLLVLSATPSGAPQETDAHPAAYGRSVEVAHEALFSAWPDLKDWIDKRREALIRRPQVERDAEQWDAHGRPDHLVPNPVIIAETRSLLEAAELWEDMAKDPRVAHFLVRDDAAELWALTREAWQDRGAPKERAAESRLALLHTLTAEGRGADTIRAFARLTSQHEPELTAWLCDGLQRVLRLLASTDAVAWQVRRLRVGDLMAALGDTRPGVGLRADGLPDIAWQSIPAGPFHWQDGEERETRAFRIARYPVTNVQYRAFIEADDYAEEDWWQEGYLGPKPDQPQWEQDNRPRVQVAWVEALAFCRWLTAHAHKQGLISSDEVVRLPTEYEWEKAARGTDGRTFPWGNDYRSGDANIDETYDQTGMLFLRETTAVGLYPRNVSPYGVVECSGNVWEWCLNKYDDPKDTDTMGQDMRVVRGGSWSYYQDSARAVYRNDGRPLSRGYDVGFRVVCASPIR